MAINLANDYSCDSMAWHCRRSGLSRRGETRYEQGANKKFPNSRGVAHLITLLSQLQFHMLRLSGSQMDDLPLCFIGAHRFNIPIGQRILPPFECQDPVSSRRNFCTELPF